MKVLSPPCVYSEIRRKHSCKCSSSARSDNGPGSQRNRFLQYPLPQSRQEEPDGQDVGAAPKERLHIYEHAPERQAGAPGHQLDEQVDVTVCVRIASRHGAEHADVGQAMPFRQGQKRVAVLDDQWIELRGRGSWR